MRRIPSFIFLILYLLASTELHQLIRTPQDLVHEHQVKNPGIGLTHFIASISVNPDLKNEKSQQKLPLKHDKCTEVFIAIAMPPEDNPITSIQHFHHASNVSKYESFRLASSYHYSKWQPPRA